MSGTLPKALAKLIPPTTLDATTTIYPYPTNLYRTLSRLPRDGIGSRVAQRRWDAKGIHDCYWEVSRTKLKHGGAHGKAWGRLVWRGKPVSTKEEEIRGGLKYYWKVVTSKVEATEEGT